jgi:hypothetical protein
LDAHKVGKSRNATVNLSNIASIGFVINGGVDSVGSGYSVSSAGDESSKPSPLTSPAEETEVPL